MTEMVVLVNEHDQQVGLEEKIAAHEQGLLHRAFSVFIIRPSGGELEILLQQRSADKYHCGGLWTNTCCSHPRENETIIAAAERRLYEEMGMQISLQELSAFIYKANFTNGLIEHEYDHVLIGYYAGEEIIMNPLEVQNYAWITLIELQDKLAANPEQFTPWLLPALNLLQANLEMVL